MDVWHAVKIIDQGFQEGINDLAGSNADALEGVLSDNEDDLFRLGREAAAAALAPLLWAAAVGETWNTTRAAEFLKVTRQALYKRIQSGSILALPGRGTSEFPVWQFDPETRLVRHIVGSIVGAFRSADDQVSSLVIASWATTPNARLDGLSPAQWINDGRDENAVLTAARRAARGLAS